MSDEADLFRPAWARLFDGLRGKPASWLLTRFFVLRLLGLVYFIAFLSALLQARALIGSDGLLPMGPFLRAVRRVSGSSAEAFFRAPSLFWIDASNITLVSVCLLGLVAAGAVLCGATNAFLMLVLWVAQLSLSSVGQIFWGYGWEIQLLETGMIAVFLCPLGTIAPFASAPAVAPIWLLRWLVVRIMLGAGLIKLRGDPCWRELTCLVTHYETQPNPSPLSWVLHQLPAWFHTAGVLFNHFVELVVPLFALGPRRVRHVAGALMVSFQLVLIASGNLSFLNWLTIVPALACFDDAFWSKILRSLRVRVPWDVPPPSRGSRRAATAYTCLVAVLSVGPVTNLFARRQMMNASFDPLHLVNTYGAFGSVNRVRDELVVEGTVDEPHAPSASWKEYDFPCKPGPVLRRPCLVTPYHYRLDWQMWFAAMSSYEEEPWIVVFVDKLLRGDRDVLSLLDHNPFPERPPRFVRISLYRYEFTRRGEGSAWWRRRRLGEYMRPLSIDDPDLADFLREHRHAE